MRCRLAVLLLCTVSPLYAAELDNNHAERLIWEGRFQEAVAYLEPLFLAETPGAAHLLCLACALWGNDKHALHYCSYALPVHWHAKLCVERELQQKGERSDYLCPSSPDYDKFAELKALQALAYWRSGDAKEAANPLHMALAANKPVAWLVQMIDVAIRTSADQQQQALSRVRPGLEFWEKPRFDLAHARIFPGAAQQAAAAAQRRKTYITVAVMASVALLAAAAAYHQRARLAAFLHTPASPTLHTVEGPGIPSPRAPAYMRYPSYFEAGYMNRAYQIAAYCWVAVWLLVCLPIVALLAIPAVTILLDFSATGLRSGARRFEPPLQRATPGAWSRLLARLTDTRRHIGRLEFGDPDRHGDESSEGNGLPGPVAARGVFHARRTRGLGDGAGRRLCLGHRPGTDEGNAPDRHGQRSRHDHVRPGRQVCICLFQLHAGTRGH